MPVPCKGKGKKKHSLVIAELTPPPAYLAPSASQLSTPAPPVSPSLVTSGLSPGTSAFAPHLHPLSAASWLSAALSTTLVDRVTSLNDSLTALAAGHIFAAQGYLLPFDDSPNAPTLASAMHDLLPCDAPQHPPLIHGMADSAAPPPSAPACGPPPSAPAYGPPLEATAHPLLAPKPAPPPWPAWSAKHSPPPSSVKHSYTDTVCDVTSLVNLTKMIPDLPSDHIIAMHQASVLPAAPKQKIKFTIPSPSQWQVLIKIDPLPSSLQFPALVGTANCSLSKSDLWVDSCHFTYRGISLLTSCVASQGEIDLMKAGVSRLLSLAEGGVEAALPCSWSYLKVMDVPFFKADGQQVTADDVWAVMGRSHMASLFTLANSPQVMCNSHCANTATMWFELMESIKYEGAINPSVDGNTIQVNPGQDDTYSQLTTLQDESILAVMTAFSGDTHILTITYSTDGRNSFQFLGTVVQAANDLDNGHLVQLPNGDIVCTFRNNDKNGSTYTFYCIMACISHDNGQTWFFLSQVDQQAINGMNGLWEPFGHISKSSALQVYYPSENNAGDQDILMHSSTDSGLT
ncbi:hypothetical protein AN958_12062 [Leucoagaricus sp. SymC.cos]|nr:hypothetical protein AN958_12062 [Leucoagaricus sp. SymC.cos]